MDIRKIDALTLLQSLDDKSVDLILTDPPYYKKLLNISWDNQWKTKEDYLNWLDSIVKECQRVLKDNGSFYMFASAEMSWYVEGVIRKYFNVLNHIRWNKPIVADGKPCTALTIRKEDLRKFLNYSEEIIFAEQFVACKAFNQCNNGLRDGLRGDVFEPIITYLDNARICAGLSSKQCDEICGNQMSGHYFTKIQFALPTEENYNKLKQHMDLKPYEEIRKEYETLKKEYEALKKEYGALRKEYEALRRTFKLTADKAYNNTWNFKQTPAKKGRHPCEKPEDLISHIIDVSSNEGDLVVDMFCGSCVVSKCCDKLNRRCIAGDVDDSYFYRNTETDSN